MIRLAILTALIALAGCDRVGPYKPATITPMQKAELCDGMQQVLDAQAETNSNVKEILTLVPEQQRLPSAVQSNVEAIQSQVEAQAAIEAVCAKHSKGSRK